MKAKKIGYWVATALVAFVFLGGGVTDLQRGPEMVAGMGALGYPAYFLLILGTWKVLGGVVILAPKLPRLKEWAYAGFVFDLTGASLSHAASGDPTAKVLTPLFILLLVAASWWLRPKARVLGALMRGESHAPRSAAPEPA